MKQRAKSTIRSGRAKSLGRASLALAMFGLLAGCSSTPDWANPVEWYRGVAGVFSGDKDQEVAEARARAKANEKTSAGSGQPYPKLSSVPERPKDLGAQRDQVQQGLAADRAQARHVDMGSGGSATAVPQGYSVSTPPGAPPPPSPPASSQQATRQEARTPEPAPPPAAPPPPSAVPQRAPEPPPVSGDDGVRSAFEDALKQSAPTVTTAPAGLRDMNHSPVLTRRNTMPVPPPTLGGDVTLRPPPRQGVVPVTTATGIVYFDSGSSRLSENDRNKLKDIVNLYKQQNAKAVRVVGHASSRTRNIDPVNHQLVNFRVSLDRANAVAKELARLGVPMDKIEVSAVADNEPVYYEVMPAGEAGNRRTEIFLDY